MADNQDTTRTTLNILIYEYLSKNNYSETADVFKREAQVEEHAQTDSGPVLLTWFEMFDDICKIRSGKSKAFDTLTRVEAIMVKLENDKTRCNKHLITRQHNVNREREISDHVGQINTSQLNFSMPNNYNQNIRRDSLNNNIKMMVNKNTAQLRKTPRMTQLSHPQIQQFRHLPNSMQPTTMEIPYPDQQYHYRQSPNYPIHPNFSGQHIQTPNHDMTFNQDMAQKYGSDGRYFFTEKDAPERKRVSDTIDYSDGKKYGQSNDFSDGKKYGQSNDFSDGKKYNEFSDGKKYNEFSDGKKYNEFSDGENNEFSKYAQSNEFSDGKKYNEFAVKQQSSQNVKHTPLEQQQINYSRINMNIDQKYSNQMEITSEQSKKQPDSRNVDNQNILTKNSMSVERTSNDRLNILKKFGEEKPVTTSFIFQDDDVSLIALFYQTNELEIFDLNSLDTLNLLDTGIEGVKGVTLQKVLITENDERKNYDQQNYKQKNQNNSENDDQHNSEQDDQHNSEQDGQHNQNYDYQYVVFFNTKDTTTYYMRFSHDFELLSQQSISSQTPAISLLCTNSYTYILTETGLFIFNLQKEVVEKIINPPLHDVKDALYVNDSLFIVRTRTKTCTWNIENNQVRILVNEPANFMTSSNVSHFHLNEQLSTNQRQNTWYSLLFRENILILNPNLTVNKQVPLAHRLTTVAIFDQTNFFSCVHRMIFWYSRTEEVHLSNHESEIIILQPFTRANGRIGLLSMSVKGETIIGEL